MVCDYLARSKNERVIMCFPPTPLPLLLLSSLLRQAEFCRRLGPPPESFMQLVPTDAVRAYIQNLDSSTPMSLWDMVPNGSLSALLLLSLVFVYGGWLCRRNFLIY